MENLSINHLIPFDPDRLDQQLRKRISLGEAFGLLLGLGLLIGFIFLNIQYPEQVYPFDFKNYLDAGRGNFHEYYYGFWMVPVFTLLSLLPFSMSYLIWGVISILAVHFAARVFGGKSVFTLLTYQMLYTLYYGQITGVILGGLALFWWGAAHKKWYLAGLGLLIAGSKYQLGGIIGGLLFLLAEISWRDRLKVLIVPLNGVLLTFLVYPDWVFILLKNMQVNPPDSSGSISLWNWIGPFSLILYLVIWAMPGTYRTKLVGAIIISPLALPYFQQNDLLFLFSLAFGPLVLIGNFGFLYLFYRWAALQTMFIIPFVLYSAYFWPSFKYLFLRMRKVV